jgi:hypothetical protein
VIPKVVHLRVEEVKSQQPSWVTRYTVRSDFPCVEASGYNRDAVINEVKGVAFCAIGCFSTVPDEVRFVVDGETVVDSETVELLRKLCEALVNLGDWNQALCPALEAKEHAMNDAVKHLKRIGAWRK